MEQNIPHIVFHQGTTGWEKTSCCIFILATTHLINQTKEWLIHYKFVMQGYKISVRDNDTYEKNTIYLLFPLHLFTFLESTFASSTSTSLASLSNLCLGFPYSPMIS